MYYNYYLYILLFLIKISQSTDSKLLLYNNKYQFDSFDLFSTYEEFKDNRPYQFIGKIVYLNNCTNILNILDKYNNYYNKNWVFLIDDINEFNIYQKLINSNKNYYFINPIIIPQKIETNIEKNLYINLIIFIVNDNDFNIIKQNDFFDNENNIFTVIQVNLAQMTISLYSLKLFCYIFLFINFFIIIIYRYKFRIYPRSFYIFLSKTSVFLPMLKIILFLLLISKIHYYELLFQHINFNSTSIVDIIIFLIDIIYYSLDIYFSLIVSKGIDLVFNLNQNRNYIKLIYKYFIFVYSLYTILKILDLFLSKIFYFDIILFIIYTLLLMYMFLKTKKNLIILKYRLFLAINSFSDYIPSIKYKIKLMKCHLIVYSIFYICFFISFCFCFWIKIINFNFNYSYIIYNAVDMIKVIGYTYLYAPQDWPDLFELNLFNNASIYNNVYNFKLKKNNFINNDNNKKINENYPLLIINPNFDNNNNKLDNNQLINEYLKNCLIGNIQKEKEKKEIKKNIKKKGAYYSLID